MQGEGGGKLPSVSSVADRPVLDLFVKTACDKLPRQHRARYVQNILLPLVDESARQHNRWMKSFLGRFQITDTVLLDDIDFGPFNLQILNEISKVWAEYLPDSFLHRHRSYALSYVRQP
jgi:hypothetical protein